MEKSTKKKASVEKIRRTIRKRNSKMLFIGKERDSGKSCTRMKATSKLRDSKDKEAKDKEIKKKESAAPPPMSTYTKIECSKDEKKGKDKKLSIRLPLTEQKSLDLEENDGPAEQQEPAQKKQKALRSSGKSTWVGKESAISFFNNNKDMNKIKNDYQFLESLDWNKPAKAFWDNMERNRCTRNIVYDENRIVLDRPGQPDLNYINASLITMKDFPNKMIVTQLPKMENESFVEDFWQMIYQENITMIYMMCSEKDTKDVGTKLFQEQAGQYQYVGKMFINNRKAESEDDLRLYTIEVLPEGNSDAVICQVMQHVTWKYGCLPNKLRLVIKMIHNFLSEKEVQNAGVCVVSLYGSGRACSFIAALIAISQLNKGIEPKITEIFKSIKQQRAGATEQFMQYVTCFEIVFEYIKRKMGKEKEFAGKVGTYQKDLINWAFDEHSVMRNL